MHNLLLTRFSFLQKKVNGEVPAGGVGAAIIADINKQVKEDIPVWENKKYAIENTTNIRQSA